MLWAISCVYLSFLSYLLFFAFFRKETNTAVNLIPFKNIVGLTSYTFKTGNDWWHWFINIPGNILVFIPMALPLFLMKGKSNYSLWFVGLISVIPMLIEALQYTFQSGACDVDDILLNTAGIWMGCVILDKRWI